MAEDEPTYLETVWAGVPMYLCLFEGHQDFTLEPFEQHMGTFHGGVMVPAATGPGPEAPTPETVDAPEESAGSSPEAPTPDPEAPPEAVAPAAEGA